MKKAIRLIIGIAVLSLCAVGAHAKQLVITANVNMRSEPSVNGSVVGVAPKDAIVELIDQRGSWYKVQYNRSTGWISNDYATPLQSRAGEMFTKQDVSVPPPNLESDGEREALKYAHIIENNTHIYANLDAGPTQSPILYTARRKGDVFVLIAEGNSWCRVKLKVNVDGVSVDTNGMVKRSSVDISDDPNPKSAIADEAKNIFIGLGVCGALVLIIVCVITIRHIRSDRKRKIYVQKNALILAKESKHVQYMLTNSTATMEHCFREIGFNVSVAKDSVVARNSIENNMPDVILVDWNFEPAIYIKIDNLFVRMTQQADTQQPAAPYVIFYNVADPSSAPPAKALRNASFLGLNVSDRDIFKVVTPLLVHTEAEQSPQDIQKGVQRCALEGEIAGGNLLEVLQFIEIGSKTGCLMVETKGPFGLVYFRDGRIVFAAAERGQGVEAVYAILNQPSGKFRFITNKQPKVANLNLPTLSVLMEWTKEKDEAHRG